MTHMISVDIFKEGKRMNVELDKSGECKDKEGNTWVLVPRRMPKPAETVLRKYKASNSITPYATYNYLMSDKPKFEPREPVGDKPKIDDALRFMIMLVFAIGFIATAVHMYFRYQDKMQNIYTVTLPSVGSMYFIFVGTLMIMIYYKVLRR